MLRKFVIVKHMENSGKYLFFVPMNQELFAGDAVICDTSRGKDQLGTCCCDAFMADPDVICPLFGTYEKNMKYVAGKVLVCRFSTEDSVSEDGSEFPKEDQLW